MKNTPEANEKSLKTKTLFPILPPPTSPFFFPAALLMAGCFGASLGVVVIFGNKLLSRFFPSSAVSRLNEELLSRSASSSAASKSRSAKPAKPSI